MLFPEGDHAGCLSMPALLVDLVRFLPVGDIV